MPWLLLFVSVGLVDSSDFRFLDCLSLDLPNFNMFFFVGKRHEASMLFAKMREGIKPGMV